jgi:hypothetical protein
MIQKVLLFLRNLVNPSDTTSSIKSFIGFWAFSILALEGYCNLFFHLTLHNEIRYTLATIVGYVLGMNVVLDYKRIKSTPKKNATPKLPVAPEGTGT